MKRTIFLTSGLIILSIIFPISLFGWTMQIDGDRAKDDALGIAVDSDRGEVYVTGYKSIRNPYNPWLVGYKLWIAKYRDSNDGPVLEWEQDLREIFDPLLSGFGNEFGRDIVLTEDRVYVIGRYYSGRGLNRDVFIVALNRDDGSIEWHTLLDIFGFTNYPGGIVVDSREDSVSVYVTGYADAGEGIYPQMDTKIFIAKYILPEDTPEWITIHESPFNPPAGDSSYERGNDLVIGGDGFLYIIGTVSRIDQSDFDYGYSTTYSRWFAKIAPDDGSLIWERTGEIFTSGHDITLDNEGFVWIIGTTDYGQEVILQKYNTDGDVLFEETHYTSVAFVSELFLGKLYGIVGLPGGGVAWVGYEGSDPVNYNIFTSTPNWNDTIDGPASGHDYGRAIAVDNRGYIYIAGKVWMEHEELRPPWVFRYGHDIFLHKYPDPIIDSSIRLSPIPDMAVSEGEELNFTIIVENPGDRSFNFSMEGLPEDVSSEDVLNPVTGEFRWIPDRTHGDGPDGSRQYTLAFHVTDGIETADLLVNLTVTDVKPNLTIAGASPRLSIRRRRINSFFSTFTLHLWVQITITNNGDGNLLASEGFSVAHSYNSSRYLATRYIPHDGIGTGDSIVVSLDMNWFLYPLRFKVDSNDDIDEENELDNEYIR